MSDGARRRTRDLSNQWSCFAEKALKEGLIQEVRRLAADPWRPAKRLLEGGHADGRPGWWWRVKVLEWAMSIPVRNQFRSDNLRDLRRVFRNLDDAQICDWVLQLLPEERGHSERR